MPLVDDTDINVFLPQDKLTAEQFQNLDACKEDTERVIRGYLAGTISAAELATWTTPATTPSTIRAIGGRLCAALIYRSRYSEDSLDDPEYAQNLYDQAMAMINGILTGAVVIDGVDPSETDALTTDMFYPNDPNTDAPKFSMSSEF